MIGIVLWREPNVSRLVDWIVEAEAMGVLAVWLTTTGDGRAGPDALAVFAAANR